MSIWRYIFRQIQQNRWSVFMVLLFATLATSLSFLATQLPLQAERHIQKSISGTDLVIGAKGSPLQLVLSSVFFVDNPTGNIQEKDVSFLKKNPLVDKVLPISLGDNYKGYRLIGTEASAAEFYRLTVEKGRFFNANFEVVAGAKAANRLQLQLGDKIASQHGLAEMGETHQHLYNVVGILQSCGCPSDQVLFSSKESMVIAHGGKAAFDAITALLVKSKSAMGTLSLPRMINQKSNLQTALPSIEADRLSQLTQGGFKIIHVFSFLFFVVCALAMVATFMGRIKEVLRDAAILQLSGFGKLFVVKLIFLEAIILVVLGFALGWVLYGIVAQFVLPTFVDAYGISFSIGVQTSHLWMCFGGLMVCALIASLFPIVRLYRQSLHQIISKEGY